MVLESIAAIHAKKGRKSDKYHQTLNLCQILENLPIKFKFSGCVFLNRYFDIYLFGSNSEMVWWKPLVDLTWNDPIAFVRFPKGSVTQNRLNSHWSSVFFDDFCAISRHSLSRRPAYIHRNQPSPQSQPCSILYSSWCTRPPGIV